MSSLYISHQPSGISFQQSLQTESWSLNVDGHFLAPGLLIRHHTSSYVIDYKTGYLNKIVSPTFDNKLREFDRSLNSCINYYVNSF